MHKTKKISILSAAAAVFLFASAEAYARDTEFVEFSVKVPKPAVSDESKTQKAPKVKTAVSRQTIDRQIAECKNELKEIIKDAEKGIIDKKAEEEIARRKAEKEMAKRKAEEEIAKKKAEKEMAKKKAEEERAAVKTAKEKAIAEKKAAEAKRAAEKRVAQEMAKRKAEEEISRKKAEKEMVKRKAEEEIAMKKAEEDAAKRAAEEKLAAARQEAEEAARQGAAQEAAKTQAGPAVAAKEVSVRSGISATERIIASIPQTQTATIKAPSGYTMPAPIEPPASGEEVSAMYREAVALYWDGKYSEAKMKFEEVQKASPEYARTNYYLARVKEKLNN